MEVAEEIRAMAGDLLDEAQEKLNDAVVRIFEECSFQDIIGQRIKMLVRTLEVITSRVEGGLSAPANEVAKKRHKELDSKLDAPVVRAKKKLLHCPQDEEADASQDDMDKQFASFD